MGSFSIIIKEEETSPDNQNLRHFLESRWVYPPYAAKNDQKLRRKYEFYSTVQLTVQILWTLRYLVFFADSVDNPLNYYLADSNYMLGPTRFPMNILFALLNFSSLVTVIFTKFSETLQPGTHLYWLRACKVFETQYFREIGKFTTELKLLYSLKPIFIAFIIAICFSVNINFFLVTPAIYWIWGVIFLLYHIVDASIVFFYLIYRQAVFIFQMYLHARYFIYLSICVKMKRLSPSTLLKKYFTSHLELIGLYQYYDRSLCLIFIFFSIVQIILCYYIFFIQMILIYKASLILILLISHSFAIGGIFIIGTFLRNKHNELIRKLFSLATKSGPDLEKMNLLNIIENSWNKTELRVMGEVCLSSPHYLLLLIETGSTLLLLTANSNR
ncbi:uncharacterized protein LOC141850159 [Brevipalpus obovatus]|uniref:uncharacterized protein LOC141850159 n=1 Tax=Brevipalpus obovatus TaxID=246614 RepID=UPI003D9EA594